MKALFYQKIYLKSVTYWRVTWLLHPALFVPATMVRLYIWMLCYWGATNTQVRSLTLTRYLTTAIEANSCQPIFAFVVKLWYLLPDGILRGDFADPTEESIWRLVMTDIADIESIVYENWSVIAFHWIPRVFVLLAFSNLRKFVSNTCSLFYVFDYLGMICCNFL